MINKETMVKMQEKVKGELKQNWDKLEGFRKVLSFGVQGRIETLCGGVVNGLEVELFEERVRVAINYTYEGRDGKKYSSSADFDIYCYDRSYNNEVITPKLSWLSTQAEATDKHYLTYLSVLGVVANNFEAVCKVVLEKLASYKLAKKELKIDDYQVQLNDIDRAIKEHDRLAIENEAMEFLKVGKVLKFFPKDETSKARSFTARINNNWEVSTKHTWEILKVSDKTVTVKITLNDGRPTPCIWESERIKISDFVYAYKNNNMGVEIITTEAEVK